MDEMQFQQQSMNQDAALAMGRTAYMTQDNAGINTLLSELTDTEKDIYETELLLQGIKINDKGEQEQACHPLCNKEGAANMIRIMRAQVGNVMQMSNLEEEQIRVMTQELAQDMIEDLTFNKKRYGIIHPKAVSTIVDLISWKAFACGMQALENGTRRMLRGTTMETTINTQGQAMKTGKGGLGSILGLGRK